MPEMAGRVSHIHGSKVLDRHLQNSCLKKKRQQQEKRKHTSSMAAKLASEWDFPVGCYFMHKASENPFDFHGQVPSKNHLC